MRAGQLRICRVRLESLIEAKSKDNGMVLVHSYIGGAWINKVQGITTG